MEVCCSYRCAETQHQCTTALVRAKRLPHYLVLLCKTGSQHACATAVTPMEICCSYRCTATFFFCKKQCPHLSAALQDRLAAGLYHCNYTHEEMVFIQGYSDPTLVHCNILLCKKQCPQLSAALQDRLAAGLHHCNCTHEDLLFTQVCSDPTPVHCTTVFCKMQCSQLSAALEDRLAAGLYHCNTLK